MSDLPTATSRRVFMAAAVLSAVTLLPVPVTTALAYDESSKSAINLAERGIALRGYDPVAYFTAGAPTKGNEALSATHDGARYLFASAANRDAFVKEPAKYVPAYGGFCAMGAVFQKKLDGDPNIWRIVDGKLYLNVHADAAKRWQQDVPGHIAQADRNWPNIKDKAPKEL